MNEPQDTAPITPAAPETTTPSAQADVLANPALPPQMTGQWSIPSETAVVLRDLDDVCVLTLRRLGENEVEYLARKGALMDELRSRQAIFKKLLDDAARKAGLDIDKQHWALDMRTMTLKRSN